ncbi:MAG: glycoside hydrolase family 15 protein [Bacteroidales bacterium]|nr:glycoside hydrolase family 15 protein [Bacteroidales bacterium]
MILKYKHQIDRLIKSTKQVFEDCCLGNGAIVAANSSNPDYPSEAKNYQFVWPRDGSYICLAANLLSMDIEVNFFNWCSKAEGWARTGLFFEKYYINGRKAALSFQPDQTGIFLYVLGEFLKKKNYDHYIRKQLEYILKNTADGLCKLWNGKHLTRVSQDLWEERLCFPDLEENFTYSIAACSAGLFCAYEILNNERWLDVAGEMQKSLIRTTHPYFIRSYGKHRDERVDASLLGLVWPYSMVTPDDEKMINTVKQIENLLVKGNGLFRYEHDEYDGWMYKKNIHRRKGAGYWPLLNFWMSIYYHDLGNNVKAEEYFFKVLDDLKDSTIPEQIFLNEYQVAVKPLAWSHAMFVIASYRLGYLT